MFADDVPVNSNTDQYVDSLDSNEQSNANHSLPVYRSHIQKRNLNLGRYYDGMMRAKHSQLPTHDLRCNLSLINNDIVSQPAIEPEGVTEETVRKGRTLLNSIPTHNERDDENNVQNR
jgi:hypothetical protein